MSLTDYQLDARRLVKELFTVPEPEPKGDANRIYEQLETPEAQNASDKFGKEEPISVERNNSKLTKRVVLTICKHREYSDLEIEEIAEKLPESCLGLYVYFVLCDKFHDILDKLGIEPYDPDYETQVQKQWDLYRNGKDGKSGLKGRLIDHIRNLVESKDGKKDSAFIAFKDWLKKEGLSDMVYLYDDKEENEFNVADGLIEVKSIEEGYGDEYWINIDRAYTPRQLKSLTTRLTAELELYYYYLIQVGFIELIPGKSPILADEDIYEFTTTLSEQLTDLSDSSLSPKQRKSVKRELQDFIKESIFAEVIRLKTDEDEGTEVRQEGTEGSVHGRDTCVVDKPRQGQYSNLTNYDKKLKTAIDKLLEACTDDGEKLFSYRYQWYAVYRVLKEHRQFPPLMPDFLKKMINLGYELDETKVLESMKKISQVCPCLPPKTEDWVLKRDVSKSYYRLAIAAEFLLHELGIKE